MNENTNKVESVLFSSGRKISIDEIKKVCRIRNDEEIINCINELKKRYNDETSLMIVEENNAWKMTVREKYLQYIKKIVTDTELTKTVMETLAVIAWKNPAFQSDVIKIRTNKAYDHIKELEESNFIETSKYGRTRLLKLTKKFYDYFDLEDDKDIKKVFGDVKHPKMPQTKVIDYEETDENLNNQVEIVDELESNEEKPKVEIYEIEKDKQISNVEIYNKEKNENKITEIFNLKSEKDDENDSFTKMP
ncbi:MAG: SMC-Scp complex subunit ScpB [Candidatus Woesearchaeota archaeon]